jgi:hypothetical protein
MHFKKWGTKNSLVFSLSISTLASTCSNYSVLGQAIKISNDFWWKYHRPIWLIHVWQEVKRKFDPTLIVYKELDLLLIRVALSHVVWAWEKDTYLHAPPPHPGGLSHEVRRFLEMSRTKKPSMQRVRVAFLFLMHVCRN